MGPHALGHAISQDLIRWEHLPIALEPDELGHIFSEVQYTIGTILQALHLLVNHP